MLFLCEMEVRLPHDMPPERAEDLKAREREYSQAAQRDGRWPHLWRVAGRYANVSVLDVGSVDDWEWRGPTHGFGEVADRLGAPQLVERCRRAAAG